MLQPSLGSITIDNKDFIDEIKLKASNLSIVFQYHSLIENLNVLENISLPIMIFKGKLDKDDNIFLDKLLSSTNMMDKKFRYPRELSGGEKQRVSIIRSIALKPKCIFMDEPTGNLDNDTSLLIHELTLIYTKMGHWYIWLLHTIWYLRVRWIQILILRIKGL